MLDDVQPHLDNISSNRIYWKKLSDDQQLALAVANPVLEPKATSSEEEASDGNNSSKNSSDN